MFCIVRRACRRYGFKEVAEDEDWNLYWTDYSVALERVMDMKRYQVQEAGLGGNQAAVLNKYINEFWIFSRQK